MILRRIMQRKVCLVVLFFSSGSLLCRVESTVYKSGVQHDVPISSLVAAGCAPCYETPYGSVSKSQDITSCTGPYLFVGTQIGDKQVFEIGALTSVDVLRMESTRSEPYLHGIKEQGGGVRGYDGRASIDLSQSLQLADNMVVDKNVSLLSQQVSVRT